ncbi:MAG: DNA primase [Actinomycetes bacterium]
MTGGGVGRGRILDEDVALVKERTDIADVVGEHVTLRNAGGGNLKGLCPFHDEKSPSFSVRPSVGTFHCFGCGVGGDAISFVMQLEHLSFAETIERLAGKAGITLRYSDEGRRSGPPAGQRQRLIAAHRSAAEYYVEQLATPGAAAGREFLLERGFDADAAAHFGVGYAPQGWDHLVRHLRGRGYTEDELVTGGLARRGPRGLIDAFRGRLVWPIRDIGGDTVGFGARRLYDDDPMAKYVNTIETPIYRKSEILYGLDLAKRDIARDRRAVVVEGYTDVMACHLAGVTHAVATCGTAFGAGHIKVLRRLLLDEGLGGEVVFTFDGDEAGRKAALRAFQDDQRFVAQTFVAVQPDGLDPCELRQQRSDAAVRELVGARVPLFEFAIRSTLAGLNLDTAEGRVAGLRAAAPVVAAIRDRALRPEYARQLAGWLGMEVAPVMQAVTEAGRGATSSTNAAASVPLARSAAAAGGAADGGAADEPAPDPIRQGLHPRDPRVAVERELLKVALQAPLLVPDLDQLEPSVFLVRAFAELLAALRAAGGVAAVVAGRVAPGQAWVDAVRAAATHPLVTELVTELAVEPIRAEGPPDARDAVSVLSRVEELALQRQQSELHSRLQRMSPEDGEDYTAVFASLIELENRRRTLQQRVLDHHA